MQHYHAILSAIAENDGQGINEIKLLEADETKQILDDFNATEIAYPSEKSVLELFREQVNRNPQKIALVFESQEFTYQALEDRSNQFAR